MLTRTSRQCDDFPLQQLLAAQQQHDAHIHSLLTADRTRLEKECAALREQLGHAASQVAIIAQSAT